MADNFGLKIGIEGEKEFKKVRVAVIFYIFSFIALFTRSLRARR